MDVPRATDLRIDFSLTPLDQVERWGGNQLHWFALTDGVYRLRFGDHAFPDDEVDYYLARVWEDLLVLAPAALEPVPADLVDLVRGEVVINDEDLAALHWYSDHYLDFGYVQGVRGCQWWRLDDVLHVEWPGHHVTMPVEAFTAALTGFHHALMAAMEQRVRHCETQGVPPGTGLDVAGLRREHEDRKTWLAPALRPRTTDLAAVRRA
ncbi:DUF5984 family protein [Saccharothrix variisporea]|uniref:Uncharacterized protein n=1 Tax=Saccharothrix variisporea TaxID=543527 RepID=A0A495XMF6_9PSEU|nr:DUF5984 family protein [Saccharothrix variisporea]RKT72798.1 hypothetical protein DFJ66_6122 [Saccharothrix variisporea]